MVESKPDAVEYALEKMTPFLMNVRFGGMMGYTTGYAMKKISKAVDFSWGLPLSLSKRASTVVT
jgi:uncharacterized membrane protein (Fun14 family)